jgi:outer membrane receptor protein involved in Fe transport
MFESKLYVCAAAVGKSRFNGATQSCNRMALYRLFALYSLALMLAAFMPLNLLHAQTNLADITGTITDSTGALVSNSKVTVLNKATSATRTATTGPNGLYSFPSLPLDTYMITATAPGFQASTTTVDLTLSGVTANLSLKVGNGSETVTVSGASGTVALQTEDAEVNQSFGQTQLQELPNTAGLSVLSIAVLGPASQAGTDEPESGDASFYNQVSNSVNIAGLGIAHAQFLQDGVENVNLLTATANVVSNVEAAQGVTTTLNGSPARFGQPAVINVITKSGTNSFHGSAYDFFQNDDLNATNWYATSKPPVRYNNFGASLGGPILKRKVFAFFNYTGLRSHSEYVSENRVPTTAELAGNFSGDNISTTIYDPLTYDPTTGTSSPFLNNQIPSDRIDNFAKLWLKNYPAANVPLGANNINYIVNLPQINNSNQYIARGDWNIADNNQLVATWLHGTVSNGSDTFVPGLFGIFYNTTGTNTSLQDSWILNQRMVNIIKVGFNRGQVLRTQQGTGAVNYAKEYGLNNVDASPSQWTPPTVSITNYAGLGDQYSPQGGLQNRYQFADEFDWTLGRHSVAIGGQFVKTQFFGNWTVLNNAGYTFDGSATSQYIDGQRSTTSTGNAFADLLLGYPQSGTTAVGTSVGWFRESQVAAYVQDDWKVSQRLTVNLGLRYDFDNPPIDKNGGALYSIALNTPIPGTWNTNYNDYGPRIGFSWNVLKNTVVRGGYGIYFSPILYNNLQFSLLYAPNFILESKSINIVDPSLIENLFAPISTGNSGYTIAKTLKDQSADEWNLNIERSLNDNTLFTVAYVGDVTRHMSNRADGNQPYALSPGNTSGILDVKPQPLAGPVTIQQNVLTANYHALAASLQRRYASGFQFLVSYTWSKAMDIADGDNTNIENIYHPRLTYSPASFDRTNNVQMSGIYDLPFGPGRHFLNGGGVLNREVLGGWQLSFIQQLASGQPVSVGANNTADTSYAHAMYALETCNPKSGFTKTRFLNFNPACFAQPAPGIYGTTRNVSATRQPGLYPTNLSLFKAFPIFREQQLQFRVDAFSILNHPEFGGGGANAGSPSLGLLTYEASGLRTMQVSLKYQF